jgi:serine/threonine protein kinase
VPDGSGLFVGPATAPDALELVALIGAGGDGEVWRAAVRNPGVAGAVGDDVAVKIARPAGADVPGAQLLTSLAHPGLVRVRAAFTGAQWHRAGEVADGDPDQYVVMDWEAGPTLRQWSAEHPAASLTERAHLLRQVAAALDALHAGAGAGEPVAHGGIRPDNVIVRPNGSAVVVDLGGIRLTSEVGMSDDAAYTAPELRRPGARATVQGDAFAFAVTVAEVLTGLPAPVAADGNLDAGGVVRQLRTSAVTRRHAVLIRQLGKALAAPAEARPRQLRPWLDEALEPQRQTITGPEQLLPPEVIPAGSKRRRNAGLVAALTLLLIASAATAGYLGVVRSRNDASPPPAPATTPLDFTDWTWPLADPCDETTAVAMPAGGRKITRYENEADPRKVIADRDGGGSWRAGHLRFTLVSRSSDVIWVTDLTPKRIGYEATAPAWIYRTVHSGCTPRTPGADREYLYQAGGALTEPGAKAPPGHIERFHLDPGATVRLDIDVRSCVANVKWQLSVKYFVAGQAPAVLHIGDRYRSFGYAANTPVDYGTMREQRVHITDMPAVSGSDPRCADAP